MRAIARRLVLALCLGILGTSGALGLSGCGSSAAQGTGLTAVGDITVVAIDLDGTPGPGVSVFTPGVPDTFPATPTEFALTGTNFETDTGTTAIVTFTALGGATPFAGGTSATATVVGLVASPVLIGGTTPAVAVCGSANVTADVAVTLESGVSDSSAGSFTVTFAAPTVTGLAPDPVDALIPATITVTGTGFGPVGGTANVRLAATGAAPIFADGTIDGVDTIATITSPTAMTFTSPKATNNCSAAAMQANVTVTLEDGACSLAGPGSLLTFAPPSLASIAPPTVPMTLPTAITLTGAGFAPVGASVAVRFTAGTDLFEGNTSDVTEVVGTVTGATTITCVTPAAFATTDQTPGVQARFEDGTCTNTLVGALTMVAPPVVTDVSTNLLVREGPSRAFLSRCSTRMTVTGLNFDPTAAVLVFDQAVGTTKPLGTGLLQDQVNATSTTVRGLSPTDASVQVNLQAAVRVTNPDGQTGFYTDATFVCRTAGHLQNTNASVSANANAEMEAAIDPTDPRNLATLTHDLGSTDMLLLHSEDAGTTWTSVAIGAAIDGVAAAFRSDPRVAYDRFGNLYVNYFTFGPSVMLVLQSFDNGVTFPNVITVAVDGAGGMDKQWCVIGPDGANLAQDAIYVGWDDNAGTFTGGLPGVVVSGAVVTGANVAPGPFSPPLGFVDVALTAQFSNAAVGPNGDLCVVWNDTTGPVNGPAALLFDRDPLGLFAGASFGLDVPITVTFVGAFDAIPASPQRTIYSNVEVAVVPVGPKAGRIVVAYGVENPDESDDVDVVAVISDNGGATFGPETQINDDITLTSQFLSSIRADPVTGMLVCAWYDARRDPGSNRLVDVYASASLDFGATWEFNVRLTDGQSDEAAMTNNFEYLDYLGLSILDGCCFVTWTDNSNSTLDNPGGTATQDLYATRFQFR